VRYPNGPTITYWEAHEDQSLRDGIEYVTRGPLAGAKLVKAVDNFYRSGITYTNSPRTSTHIDVHVSDRTLDQPRTMFALSFILEPALFEVIGAARKYCGYCVPLSEMNPIRMKTILTSDKWMHFSDSMRGRNEEKYYGFNINSVVKHGTVEFRYFYGGPTKSELLSWLSYCTSTKKAAVSTSLDELLSIPDPDSLAKFLTKF